MSFIWTLSLHLHPAPNRPLALRTVPFLPKRTKQRLAHPPRPPHRLMPKHPTKHPGRHTNIPDYRPLPPGHLLSPHTSPARPNTSFFTYFFNSQLSVLCLSINAAPALGRPQSMETLITMEQFIHQRVYDLVINWPIRFHSLEKVTRFASNCTSSESQTLARLALEPMQSFDLESNIKALLRIMSPKKCSIIKITDLATPLVEKGVLIDHLGTTVVDRYTAWMSYTQPQSSISAIAFLYDIGHNNYILRVKMISTPLQRHIISTLMHNRLYYQAIIKINDNFFSDNPGTIKQILQDSNPSKCHLNFDVIKTPSGPFVLTLKDSALWPQLLLPAAQLMHLELIHVTTPSELERQTIRNHTTENIIDIFRIETRNTPHHDLIVVTSHHFNVARSTISFATEGRIIWRMKVN